MAKYIKYILKMIDPVRIADDSKSQSGQTETLRYIPGSAIRGLVAGCLLDNSNENGTKGLLLSDKTVFMNAYRTIPNHSLIPSPKGFYEDKSPAREEYKEICNVVVDGNFREGMKRSSLGTCCYIKDDCIYYYPVEIGSDLRLLMNPRDGIKSNLFRNEYICSGQLFEGYIRLEDELIPEIKGIFEEGNIVRIGNARSAGMGRCQVLYAELISELPYDAQSFDAEGSCYMMLLSDTVMRSEEGEYCGLNLKEIENLFGVKNLKIEFAATSTRTVYGYNRTMKAHIPSINAYESGSVFHFSFDGVLQAETMKKLMDEGLGVRKNEGFGRILFLDNYEKIRRKAAGEDEKEPFTGMIQGLTEDDKQTLVVAAANHLKNEIEMAMKRYIIDPGNTLKKGALKNSQLGTVESILTTFRYSPSKAGKSLGEYFGHALEKEQNRNIQKEKASVSPLEKTVSEILRGKLLSILFGDESVFTKEKSIMGIDIDKIFSKEDEDRYKIELLIDMIRFSTRKEV